MRTESGKNYKSSWPKMVVKKWLNLKTGAHEFHSDYEISEMMRKISDGGRKSCSNDDQYVLLTEDLPEKWPKESPENLKRPRIEPPETPAAADTQDLRMFVGTWNVGGKCPHKGLNLKDWLLTPAPADIYVLGFQEIVPLNAGNVLGAEDYGPATKWLSLIRQALNHTENDLEIAPNYSNDMGSKLKQFPNQNEEQRCLKSRISFSDLLYLEDELDKEDLERNSTSSSTSGMDDESISLSVRRKRSSPTRNGRYCLAASKQMVGIFLCVWVRTDLNRHVSNLKVSCVGRGIMGYLGNKGSVSISMTLHQTTFCFVGTHLASGEKEGDEIRRNSDVIEILRKTRFTQSQRVSVGQPCSSPDNILDHDKIIWLGDLNYRLDQSCCGDTDQLLKKNDWKSLLEKDQLRIEQRAGRVFKGWEEGRIRFAPTYKYIANSDNYVAQTSKSKEKPRTPAWCDRILWKGKGLKQLWYVRGESRFSDHRPVYSIFSVHVDAGGGETKE